MNLRKIISQTYTFKQQSPIGKTILLYSNNCSVIWGELSNFYKVRFFLLLIDSISYHHYFPLEGSEQFFSFNLQLLFILFKLLRKLHEPEEINGLDGMDFWPNYITPNPI
jgi:hypothetical protein